MFDEYFLNCDEEDLDHIDEDEDEPKEEEPVATIDYEQLDQAP